MKIKPILFLMAFAAAMVLTRCGILGPGPDDCPFCQPIPDSLRDSVITLLLPVPDTNQAGVWSGSDGPVELLSSGVSNEFGVDRAYKIYGQFVGSWSEELEWRYNYFLLYTHHYYLDDVPRLDTAVKRSDSLYSQFDGTFSDSAYTVYWDSTEADEVLQAITSTTVKGVIGVRTNLVPTGDSVSILHVVPNSPAWSAGIQKGDIVLKVNDSAIVGDSTWYWFRDLTAGDSGTPLNLLLWRAGDSVSANLIKSVVDFPSLFVDSVGGFPIIHIFEFVQSTYDTLSTFTEFQKALQETQGAQVTLLDLRGNPGGSVNEVREMCDEIVRTGILISEEARFLSGETFLPVVERTDYNASRSGLGEGREFILLADGFSASAAEIFVSCLTEGEGVPFVGQTTFGKGIGQALFSTPAKGLSKITLTQFKSRSNTSYQGTGIAPTHPAPDSAILAEALILAQSVSTALPKLSGAALKRQLDVSEWNRRQFLRKRPPADYPIRSLPLPLHPFRR